MKIDPRHTEGKAGVNACKSLFDACNCPFQEVAGENDYGKDAYVDLTEDREITGLCIALQIKSGSSFRRAEGYAIPVEGHAQAWKNSVLPIAGVVHDEGALYWVNITRFLRECGDQVPSAIPVPQDNVLDGQTVHGSFVQEMGSFAQRGVMADLLLQLVDDAVDKQIAAIVDCYGAGRQDARVFILLRRIMPSLPIESRMTAIVVLSHCTPHPDIFWTSSIWIEPEVSNKVREQMRWSLEEIRLILEAVPIENGEWERGRNGQCAYMLLSEDPDISAKMQDVVVSWSSHGSQASLFTAFYLALYWHGSKNGDVQDLFDRLIAAQPSLQHHPLMREVQQLLTDHGSVDLF